MAEKTCRDGLQRRPSFRKTLADHAEAGLPDEYLEALEQKRKQLDESIHKYIAAKEREYKQYEKDLKQQRKLAAPAESASRPKRTSDATQESLGSPRLLGQQQSSAVDALLAAGLKREHIGQPVALAVIDDDGPAPTIEATRTSAGLTDRRASTDRNKDFIGVFTPTFLPALESKDESGKTSAPLNSLEKLKRSNEDGHRANSDTAVEAMGKRPPQLQLVQRSSSSGSSADGKLTSALKSPTQSSKPKRKRVSLAVGDTIVAPSDNVPLSMSNNSTPSHSRSRTPTPERERLAETNTFDEAKQPQSLDTALSTSPARSAGSGSSTSTIRANKPASPLSKSTSLGPPAVPALSSPQKIDPDGDLFDLEDENDPMPDRQPDEDAFESEDEIAGRVEPDRPAEDEVYDPNGGLIPEEDDNHAEHVEFIPGSAGASQQPTNPGFRRPSASHDPIYRGQDYERAEENAVNNDIYGSSYNRPTSKGSFTAGSLGESFMAQNAERLMRNRAREETEVRS